LGILVSKASENLIVSCIDKPAILMGHGKNIEMIVKSFGEAMFAKNMSAEEIESVFDVIKYTLLINLESAKKGLSPKQTEEALCLGDIFDHAKDKAITEANKKVDELDKMIAVLQGKRKKLVS